MSQGHEIICTSRKKFFKDRSLEFVFDLANGKPLHQILPAPPSVIIHLAAKIPNKKNIINEDLQCAEINKKIDDNVYRAAKRWNCHVVYASTCGLYDSKSHLWKKEGSSPLLPRTCYFREKIKSEKKFLNLQSCAILRFSSPIGPGTAEKTVFGKFCLQAIKNKCLEVWGDGLREQDFLSTFDIAKATLLASQKPWSGVLNIASGKPVTMHYLASKIIHELEGGTLKKNLCEDPQQGHTARYCIEKAQKVLKWKPKVSLENSIHDFVSTLPNKP